MQKIMIIEDEPDVREELAFLLNNEGYRTIVIQDFTGIPEQIAGNTPDLVLLDLGLPGRDGFSLCADIRSKTAVPVIFVTSRSTAMDELRALSLGGDDYITKPFRPLELVARVKAQLRRYKRYNSGYEADKDILEHSGLVLNIRTHECTLDEKILSLTPTEFSILQILCREKGKVVSAEELFHEIWGDEYFSKSNNTITVHIRHLREKMNDSFENPRYIKTVWGYGYKIEG